MPPAVETRREKAVCSPFGRGVKSMVYVGDFFFSAIGAGWTLFILVSLFH
jgi:hypothetical protein